MRARGTVALGSALAFALATFAILGFSDTLNPVDALLGRGAVVAVPDVVDDARPRAEAELEEVGLRAEVVTAFSLTEPRGTVMSQDPPAGERVRTDSEVQLVVSRGANRLEMPDAVGRRLTEVLPALEEAEIPVRVEREASETVERGVVIEQSPEPGTRVTGADEVELLVSAGPADRPVPEVAGRSLDSAAFELGRAGLELGSIQMVESPDAPRTAVIAIEPVAGTVVARDTTVDLVVSTGRTPVPVPDVVEDRESAARAALEGAGFEVAVATRLVGVGGEGLGGVFEQYPPGGTPLAPGERVTIVVGRAGPPLLPPRTTTTTTTTTTTAPSSTTTEPDG